MKSLPFFVAGMLLLSGLVAMGMGKEAGETENFKLDFLNPVVMEKNIEGETYVELGVDGANARLYHACEPMLPIYTKTLTFPFGTKIVDIECETGNVRNIVLSNKIVPAPKRAILGMDKNVPEYEMDKTIYNSDELFPDSWFSYYTGGGLDENNEHKTFVTIRAFPVRYSPKTNTITYVENLDLKINYHVPEKPMLSGNGAYDLVIITPSKLYDNSLQNLMEHKNNHGVNTFIKTLYEIYDEYSGVDKPEQIKYFIKDAIETWDIKYVMLVGGLNSPLWATPRDDANQGTIDWHLPVRYTNNKEMGSTHDPGFISDLYYADIYDSEGNFSSWDLDKNGDSDGLFANWKFGAQRDILDLYPDVYVGRLACRNVLEVKIMTNKIIDYETNTYGQEWFNKMISIGGDSHDDSGTNYNEGEVACEYVFNEYMTESTPVKLYASYRDTDPQHTPSSENIVREISSGSGFLLFEGHGHPGSWNTHWPGEFSWEDTPGGISCYTFPKLDNGKKLPIVVVGGCHNSQFNITLLGTILQKPYTWTHGQPFAECFGWNIVRKIDGGGIASFGNTGLGYGAVGNHSDVDGDGIDLPDTLEALGGYQIVQFFKTYDEGVDILGEVWGGAQSKYLDTFPAMDDQTDCKTVEQWPLLGDPSLKIGGYSP